MIDLETSSTRRALTAAGLCLALVACAGAVQRKGDQPQDYYDAGVQNMDKEYWLEAMSDLTVVKTKFPYSKYAALAELRLADVKYRSEKYLEAIDAYRLWVQYHPAHEDVGHALFYEAMAHYKEIPDDFFFLPPSHEKDQVEVDKAARAFKEYLERYPEGAFAKEAREKLNETFLKLAQHDLYVARFYVKAEKYRGAVARYETVRKYVRGSRLEPEVLLELGETYVKLDDKENGRTVFAQLIALHPETGEARAAQRALAAIPVTEEEAMAKALGPQSGAASSPTRPERE